jgi:hypothetical protein
MWLIMSKRNKKPVAVVEPQQPTEEIIKSVMELYKPNKVEKFFLKNFTQLGGQRSQKVSKFFMPGVLGVAALGTIYAILGLEQASAAIFITDVLVVVPVIVGSLYASTRDSKRVRNLMNILSKSPAEIKQLEQKYYLA